MPFANIRRPVILDVLDLKSILRWTKHTSDNIDLINRLIETEIEGTVTFAQIQDIASDRLLGRDTAGTGEIEELIVGGGVEFTGSGGIQRGALAGDITASAGSATTAIASNAVTDTKLRDSGALSVIGRSTNSSGDPADISASAASGAVLRESGSTVGFGTVATAGIADAAITYAKHANMAGLSVAGRSANSSGVPADITGTDGQVLRVSGTTLGFGSVAAAAMPALTGDVTTSAGAVATTIVNNAVTDTKLRDSGALSVLGRAANSSGDPADITASAASGAVLRESGSTVGFGTIATAGIANDAVTYAKLQNVTGLSVMGRSANSSGDAADITGTDGQILRVSGTALGFGKIKTSQITGTTTNDAATAGDIGEHTQSVIAVGSAVGLTTATAKTITSITLAAGDYDVSINAMFGGSPGGTTTYISAGVSVTNNTLEGTEGDKFTSNTLVQNANYAQTLNLAPFRLSLAGSTTVYFIAKGTFSTGTLSGWGRISARRVR